MLAQSHSDCGHRKGEPPRARSVAAHLAALRPFFALRLLPDRSTELRHACVTWCPSTGATIVVLDFIDGVLRDLPVSVKIIRDSGSGSAQGRDSPTVYHVPPKIYPMGTSSFTYQFQEPGNYAGLVVVGDGNQQATGRFPFPVGAPP
jgi:hypothetical protein